MNSIDYPILEYDPGKKALIEPSTIIKEQQVPKVCLLPFYYDTIQQFRNEGILEEIAQIESSATPNICLYALEFKGKKLAVISPGLGAPYAASILDVAIALGCRKFLAFGSCSRGCAPGYLHRCPGKKSALLRRLRRPGRRSFL